VIGVRGWFVLALALGVAGCAGGPAREPALVPVRERVLAPEALAPMIAVGAPTVESEPGVLLRVTAPIGVAPDVDRAVRLRYRFVFLDGAGRPLHQGDRQLMLFVVRLAAGPQGFPAGVVHLAAEAGRFAVLVEG